MICSVMQTWYRACDDWPLLQFTWTFPWLHASASVLSVYRSDCWVNDRVYDTDLRGCLRAGKRWCANVYSVSIVECGSAMFNFVAFQIQIQSFSIKNGSSENLGGPRLDRTVLTFLPQGHR